MFDKDNKFGFINNNNNNESNSNNIKNTDLPYVVSETTLFEITVDQLNKAWTECQSSDDTSMYIEVPNFTIKDDTLLFIEINNKRYRLDSTSTEELTEQNKIRITMEFYNINDVANNIMGGDVQTFSDKTYEYNDNLAIVKIDRIDDNKSPVFTGGIKLFEISVNKLNSLLLGKDVDIYNSLSIQRNPNSKIGEYSTAMGYFTEASGDFSHAEGESTKALGDCSHAEGTNTTASGNFSHAEGESTKALGNYSHTEGADTTASNYQSHAEGYNTTASGMNSHSEGESTKALGDCSHAEGKYTEASGESSHVEGDNSHATGDFSHAEGNYTRASASNSHTEGYSTIASSENQHVQGKYNIEDTEGKYAHIVGNGTYNKTSNAHTLDWEGNGWYAGKLSQEGTPTEDKDLVTKKYVDDNREYINYNNKQFNDKIISLHISRNPVSCSTEINKKSLYELFPELLNMTYNVVFKKSISFKVNMDNFVKDYPTVKSAYNKIGINLYDENGNSIGNSYGSYINGDGLNIVYINTTQSIRFSAYFDKALVDGSNTSMETKNGYMTIQLSIPKGDNKQEFIDKIKNLKLSVIVFKTDFLNLNNESIYTPTTDYNPSTKKYVDDKVSNLPQLSFNESGELVVTINGVSKTFVPKE